MAKLPQPETYESLFISVKNEPIPFEVMTAVRNILNMLNLLDISLPDQRAFIANFCDYIREKLKEEATLDEAEKNNLKEFLKIVESGRSSY